MLEPRKKPVPIVQPTPNKVNCHQGNLPVGVPKIYNPSLCFCCYYVLRSVILFRNRTMGKSVLQMMGATAQLKRVQISQNVSLGMRERSKQGKFVES